LKKECFHIVYWIFCIAPTQGSSATFLVEIDPDPTFTVDYLDTFYRRLSRFFKYHLRPPYKFDPKQCEKYAASTNISDVPIRYNRAYELNSRIRSGRKLICIYIKSEKNRSRIRKIGRISNYSELNKDAKSMLKICSTVCFVIFLLEWKCHKINLITLRIWWCPAFHGHLFPAASWPPPSPPSNRFHNKNSTRNVTSVTSFAFCRIQPNCGQFGRPETLTQFMDPDRTLVKHEPWTFDSWLYCATKQYKKSFKKYPLNDFRY
jgi:hypothetical protein